MLLTFLQEGLEQLETETEKTVQFHRSILHEVFLSGHEREHGRERDEQSQPDLMK